jgi:hypothetical protein
MRAARQHLASARAASVRGRAHAGVHRARR